MAVSNPTLSQIGQAISDMLPKLKPVSFPTGMIAYSHEVPDGWLQCNGAAVSRTTYAALFAVIGTKYGSGNGSTTFNLPNIHHRFIEGTTSASEVGSTVEAGLPNITGGFTAHDGRQGDKSSGAFYLVGNLGRGDRDSGTPDCANLLQYGFAGSRSSSRYGASSTVQPASLRVLTIIKF